MIKESKTRRNTKEAPTTPRPTPPKPQAIVSGEIKGCELCSDFPVVLGSRCHPTAPLRIEMPDSSTLVCYCYLPDCGREVARFRLAEMDVDKKVEEEDPYEQAGVDDHRIWYERSGE